MAFSAQYRLLIVDDDPHVHKLLVKMLPSEKYQIKSAFNADDALETLKKSPTDLVILDMMMPKTSGMELLDRMRKDPHLAQVLVLVVSAKDAQSDRLAGLTHGADDYVAKPFHIHHLIRKIEHMLAKKGL